MIDSKNFKLSHMVWQKRIFDAKSKEDVKEYAYFLKNSKWRINCPFIIEWPHLTVTNMITTKLIDAYIDKMIKDAK